jgi:hypothetical protein
MVKRTGDLLRLRQRRQSHLPRPLDLSEIRPNGKALTFEFLCDDLVDVTGLEPVTPCLQSRCSPN